MWRSLHKKLVVVELREGLAKMAPDAGDPVLHRNMCILTEEAGLTCPSVIH